MIRHQPVSTVLIGPNGSRLPDLLRGPPDAKVKALGLCGQWLPSIQIAYAASHSVALLGEYGAE